MPNLKFLTLLFEMTREEWREVVRDVNPSLSDAEFNRGWNQFLLETA